MRAFILFLLSLFSLGVSGIATTSHSLTALYATLDPTSVAQHFAFYELYPQTPEGRRALQHAWALLSAGCIECDPEMILPTLDVHPIIALVNRSSEDTTPVLNDDQLAVIRKLSQHLGNRQLKGYGLQTQAEILKLDPDQIDLARALLVAEMGNDPTAMRKIMSYEASLDLMALQILARLPLGATPKEKIRAINDYIFSEMRFRFPPHSLYAKEIDVYTFLPSVLDGRRGVCLGVSILYLSLAQRLELTLEAITPPGHIYVRHVGPDREIINIETTARGIDVPSELYLGIDTKDLQKRSIREVVGLAFMNQAAVSWHKNDSQTAVTLYEKARPFLGDDFLLNLFLGFNYLFVGREPEGRMLLEQVKGVVPSHAIVGETVAEDYIEGFTDAEGIQAVFAEVDETRSSILQKQKTLQEVAAKFPKFRQGILHLAITWLQIGREKEALPLLERYVEMDPGDPTVNYYLSAIHFQRHNYLQSWKYLKMSEAIVHAKDHDPHALQELREALQKVCPEIL